MKFTLQLLFIFVSTALIQTILFQLSIQHEFIFLQVPRVLDSTTTTTTDVFDDDAPLITTEGRMRMRDHHPVEGDNDDYDDSMSACLLIMDENHRLPEWLSYHYYTTKLRHVVIAIDPHSRTNPTEILNRFRRNRNSNNNNNNSSSSFTRMRIDVWMDSNFTRKELNYNLSTTPSWKKISGHRYRQNTFQMECIMYLKALGRKWTMFVDPDEYFALNPQWIANASTHHIPHHSSSIYNVLQEGYKSSSRSTSTSTSQKKKKKEEENLLLVPPTTTKRRSWIHKFHNPCLPIPRVNFGVYEDEDDVAATPTTPTSRIAPIWINDTSRYDTLRFVYRVKPTPMWGKTIIDVSRVYVEDLIKNGSNAHFPIQSLCPKGAPIYSDSPIGIHHYQGTWESFSYRQDARDGNYRNYDKWKIKANDHDGGKDDSIRFWMFGLERMVGKHVAQEWLQGNGLSSSSSSSTTTSSLPSSPNKVPVQKEKSGRNTTTTTTTTTDTNDTLDRNNKKKSKHSENEETLSSNQAAS